ncbi:helix-turn-helix domain-containing protein [Streptomyces massasporeus]|uniref:helix-turn-helix domain-containing protein n=1 Tax=Streptomyces massasporeus TaxID=67324 RepID=UPI003824D7CA
MDETTKRLGEALQAAREGRRPRLTQPEAAKQLGVGRSTIQNIERGQFVKINRTVREYAGLLGWPDGAVDRVAAGEALPARDGADADTETGEPPGNSGLPLPPAVEYELRTNETLDSTVINLGPDEDDGHVIVVLQGRRGATPEEVARIAERYRKARRYLQGLAGEADEVADP